MGRLTFSLNLTLDGCIDHREGVADDETHAFFTRLLDEAGAILWGRVTYELMEAYWPAVARGEVEAPPAIHAWAAKLEAKPKYVVSSTRTNFPWANSHHLAGDLATAVRALKDATPAGVLLGSQKLASALDRLDLIDEYRFLVHPRIAGHGPYLFEGGLPNPRRLELVSATPLGNGTVALHYRRATLRTGIEATNGPSGARPGPQLPSHPGRTRSLVQSISSQPSRPRPAVRDGGPKSGGEGRHAPRSHRQRVDRPPRVPARLRVEPPSGSSLHAFPVPRRRQFAHLASQVRPGPPRAGDPPLPEPGGRGGPGHRGADRPRQGDAGGRP